MIEWLSAPVDALRPHDVGLALSWHARAMVVSWGVLVPLGVLAARFFKVLPGQDWPREVDNLRWWLAHRAAQYAALGLMLIGLGLILRAGPVASVTGSVWLHHLLGWVVLAFGAVQYLAAWLRGTKGGPTDPDGLRGDHYDMTPRRLVFERVHKSVGYLAMGLAVAAILTGLWQANAPRWMWLALVVWWGLLAGAFWHLQRQGRAVDTYQAIWGPDPAHPGNHRRPIGPGVRRHQSRTDGD